MEQATDYRNRAEQCRANADVACCEVLRDEFLFLAEMWDRLASEREWLQAVRTRLAAGLSPLAEALSFASPPANPSEKQPGI
jgi:hypothetical protein